LEYLDGIWVEDADDWESMQVFLTPADYVNGYIDFKLVETTPYIYHQKTDSTEELKQGNNELESPLHTPSDYIPNIVIKQLPVAIKSGNYRRGLQEFLMKDPSTRGFKLTFDISNAYKKIVGFRSRGSLVVDNLMSLFAFGVGPSKRASVQDCAKQFLVRLKIIPENHRPLMNKVEAFPVTDDEDDHSIRALGRESAKWSDFQRIHRGVERKTYSRENSDNNQRCNKIFCCNDVGDRPRWRYVRDDSSYDREALWNQIKIILSQARGAIDVLEIRKNIPRTIERLPNMSVLNSILYEKLRFGIVQIHGGWDRKPSWSIP